ncbi:MAG: hypothetical protein JRH20_06730 [Deltaproteobacteria bacterium]|nr:hypothetical protein [Deltaproteobacteria bacterium]
MRVSLLVVIGVSSFLASCKETHTSHKKPAMVVAVSAPASLMATLTLRSPRNTLQRSLAHLRAFTALPLNAELLLGAAMQQAALPPALKSTIDFNGVLRFFFLDQAQLDERYPLVAVLPLRSERAFLQALQSGYLPPKEAKDGLQLFVPKSGSKAGPMLVWLEEKQVILPTSKRSYQLLAPFLAGRRAWAPATHDLHLKVHVAHFSGGKKKALGHAITLLATQPKLLQQSTIKRFSKQSEALLRSAETLDILADVHKKGLSIALRAQAQKKGTLHQALIKQRPGELFALNLLPLRPALVVASRGPSLLEGESALKVGVETLTSEMSPTQRARFEQALKAARPHFSDGLTFALHLEEAKGDHEERWMLTWLAEVKDTVGARQALERLTNLTHAWARQQTEKESSTSAEKVEREPLEQGSAQGALLRFGRVDNLRKHAPSRHTFNKSAETLSLSRGLTAGWVIADKLAVFALGKNAGPYLLDIVAQSEKKLGRSVPPSLQGLRRPGRTGAVYLSFLDLTCLLAKSGVSSLRALAASLQGREPGGAPLLSWGVDPTRTRLDLNLELSSEHFRPFKEFTAPLLRSLYQRAPALMRK